MLAVSVCGTEASIQLLHLYLMVPCETSGNIEM
jgi:hypothetical protein